MTSIFFYGIIYKNTQGGLNMSYRFRFHSIPKKLTNALRNCQTLEDIANSAAISSRECLRCFNMCLKETPIECLTNHRINMAKELLKTTNKSVTDIAFETGFSNAAYFTKVFKQIRQITPKEYRKLYTAK